MATFPARNVFRGFEPRREGQSWEEWVTDSLSRLNPGTVNQFTPAKVDYSYAANVALWPSDGQMGSQWFQAIYFVGSAAGTASTSETLVAQNEYQIWYDTLAADLTLVVDQPSLRATGIPSPTPDFEQINTTSLNPMQLADTDRSTRVRLMLLEFYGTGVRSVFDTDRNPVTGVRAPDIFHFYNPSSATMTSAGGGKAHPALRGWFPRQFTSPFQDPMKPDGLIGAVQIYSTSASNPVTGGRVVGTAPTTADYVLSNAGPSSWEFDCIWEKIIELPQGPLSPLVTATSNAATDVSQLTRVALQKPQVVRHFERLNIPIRRTVRYNGMTETGTAGVDYYAERRFYLVAFAEHSCMVTATVPGAAPEIEGTAATGLSPAYPAPPRILMELEGQLTFLRYLDQMGTVSDEPEEVAMALEQNDADEAVVGRPPRRRPTDRDRSVVASGKRLHSDYELLSRAFKKRRIYR